MSLIDSHTHLYFSESFPEPEEAVKRALDAGVEHMVLPGVNASTIEPVRKLHSLYPKETSMGIGLHPTDVEPETWRNELKLIEEELRNNLHDYVAIGETGIDLHWDKTHLDLQKQAFEEQLRWAEELDKPVIIHSRDGFEETFEVLEGIKKLPPVVFHSFSGSIKNVEEILEKFPTSYFGINGIVTFKNADIKNVVPAIPDERLLIETDAPYLAPVPKRGSTNESSFLVHTAKFIASLKNMDYADFANLTTSNAKRFFRL